MERADIVRRVGVMVLVAAGIVTGVFILGSSLPAGEVPAEPMTHSEYDPDALVVEPLATEGTVEPNISTTNSSNVVLVDTAHGNDLERATIAPLVSGLTAVNHSVRFYEDGDNLTTELEQAKAFVVITPTERFSKSEVETVVNATDDGMRLVLVGEPDSFVITRGPFGAPVPVKQTSHLTELGSAHDVSFDTRYLYNLASNDGNYKHVLVEAPATSPLTDLDRASVYTATAVSSANGTPLLVTQPEARLSDGGPPGRYPVAVRAGNTVAVGDRTFLRADRHTIADNEAFVEYLVEFMAEGTTPDLQESSDDGMESQG